MFIFEQMTNNAFRENRRYLRNLSNTNSFLNNFLYSNSGKSAIRKIVKALFIELKNNSRP